MKRSTTKKVPFASASASTKRKRKNGEQSSLISLSNNESPLNFKSPKEMLTSLLYPACTVDDFLKDYWEKQPLYISGLSKVGIVFIN